MVFCDLWCTRAVCGRGQISLSGSVATIDAWVRNLHWITVKMMCLGFSEVDANVFKLDAQFWINICAMNMRWCTEVSAIKPSWSHTCNKRKCMRTKNIKIYSLNSDNHTELLYLYKVYCAKKQIHFKEEEKSFFSKNFTTWFFLKIDWLTIGSFLRRQLMIANYHVKKFVRNSQ